jgi:drug/metabolite transporter (DMT)-like permease
VNLALGRSELAGDLLVLAGAACWVVYTMGTESFRGWSSLKFTVLTLIRGSIILVVVTAVLVQLGLARPPARRRSARWCWSSPSARSAACCSR